MPMSDTPDFRLVSYSQGGDAPRAGLLVVGRIHEVPRRSVIDLLADWSASLADIDGLLASPSSLGEGVPLSAVRLHPPVLYPDTVYCCGANYRDHLAEMARAAGREPDADPRQRLQHPWFFLKPARASMVGDGSTVARPPGSMKFDWEAELAVVIGAQARNVSAADALQSVAGYMVANDLSARDMARRPQLEPGSFFHFDWLAHKSFDGACPVGPWLTPARCVPNPQVLPIRLSVNGVVKQDSNTSEMIFSVAEQIAYLSRTLTLYPGDVILTGTPAGVGAGRGEFLQPGDRIDVEIGDLGVLKTTIGDTVAAQEKQK